MRKNLLASWSFAVLILSAIGLMAVSQQTFASEDEAGHNLDSRIHYYEDEGWRLSSRRSGRIHEHESISIDLHIEDNHPQTLLAVGCHDSHDLNLFLYDEHGERVASDTNPNSTPVISFTDHHGGGNYRLTVREASGGAHYALAIMARGSH